jgi:hypothetical protein
VDRLLSRLAALNISDAAQPGGRVWALGNRTLGDSAQSGLVSEFLSSLSDLVGGGWRSAWPEHTWAGSQGWHAGHAPPLLQLPCAPCGGGPTVRHAQVTSLASDGTAAAPAAATNGTASAGPLARQVSR